MTEYGYTRNPYGLPLTKKVKLIVVYSVVYSVYLFEAQTVLLFPEAMALFNRCGFSSGTKQLLLLYEVLRTE